MDSIEVPERYFCPNPLDDLTQEDLEKPNGALKYYLDRGVVILDSHNKARWAKRSKNRFLQMFWVRFVNPKRGEEEVPMDQICGKIIFDVFPIFQRKPGYNRCAINKKGIVRLIGPMFPVDGLSRIFLKPRLYTENRPDDFYHPDNPAGYKNKFLKKGGRAFFDCLPDTDRVGISGKCILDPDFNNKQSDEIITEEVEALFGKMRYSYAIFEDAIDSFVKIMLLEWKGQGDTANVYGRISASNTRLRGAKSTIFFRNSHEAVPVRPHQYIPIDRPVNIVSVGHSLELEVHIKHTHHIGESKEDVWIAKETLPIQAECVTYGRGEDGIIGIQEINGEWGRVLVKVFFVPSWSKSTYNVERDSE